ncbi:DUF3748 domain-containing protein [Pectobacteriaceae bacterium CE90]|nr:DUF3748 domain-containing protein [Pectobacteriaceae bacterium CE90]
MATGSSAPSLRYVFIHGPENPDANWPYDFHHCHGVIVRDDARHQAVTLCGGSLVIACRFLPPDVLFGRQNCRHQYVKKWFLFA